jgi:hypothetical protein
MHGTYVEERKLVPRTRESLYSGDYIKFGAEVTRGPGTCWINDEATPYCCAQPIRWLPLPKKGIPFNLFPRSNLLPESFPPLEMCISFDWVDEAYVSPPSSLSCSAGLTPFAALDLRRVRQRCQMQRSLGIHSLCPSMTTKRTTKLR